MDTIQHHGIKGQRWGIQNGPSYPLSREQRSPEEKKKSGSISDSGKDRYGKDGVSSNINSKSHEGVKSINPSKVTDRTKASLIKNASDMSDNELRSAVNRLDNENTLKQLIAEQQVKKPSELKTAKSVVGLAKNSASLVGGIAKITGNTDLASGMEIASKALSTGGKALDSTTDFMNRTYQQELKKAKKNINLSSMSDEELRSSINRLILEKRYNDLVAKDYYTISGKDKVDYILQASNIGVGTTTSAVGLANAIKKVNTTKNRSQKTKKDVDDFNPFDDLFLGKK